MNSIIDLFNKKGLNYTTASPKPTSGHDAFYAFYKDQNYFRTDASPYFWQIEFVVPVTIESYIISSPSSFSAYMKSWEVSYSLDNETFVAHPSYSIYSLKENKKIFSLVSGVYCRFFRIANIQNSAGTRNLYFNSFDCFGSIGRKYLIASCKAKLNIARFLDTRLIGVFHLLFTA